MNEYVTQVDKKIPCLGGEKTNKNGEKIVERSRGSVTSPDYDPIAPRRLLISNEKLIRRWMS